MPLYDYGCCACGCEFEDVRPTEEESGPACPECGQESQRLVSAVHLKTNPFPLKGHKNKVKMMHPADRRARFGAPPGCGGGSGGFS